MNSDGDGSDLDDMMDSDDEDNYGNYYDNTGDDIDLDKAENLDPEYFDFQLLKIEDVERLLNENVEALCTTINVRFLGHLSKISL